MSVKVHDRSYLERTIATVRNHRNADNCWPSWANIFADEIERLWAALEQCKEDMLMVESLPTTPAEVPTQEVIAWIDKTLTGGSE